MAAGLFFIGKILLKPKLYLVFHSLTTIYIFRSNTCYFHGVLTIQYTSYD